MNKKPKNFIKDTPPGFKNPSPVANKNIGIIETQNAILFNVTHRMPPMIVARANQPNCFHVKGPI